MRALKSDLIVAFLSGLAFLFLLAGPARSADFPQKPLKMIMPYPPGGGGDVVARFVAARLSDRLKQPVVVENRTGAVGMVGTGVGARSTPDGYTIIFAHADTLSINPHVYRSTITYDARRDFTPIALLGARPFAIAVHPRVPANTVPEFIKLVREQPDKFSYATWGVGSSSHIGMAMLSSGDPKLSMLHVPYQGQAPAVAALIAGQVDAMVGSLAVTGPHHQAGRLRILAVTTAQRLAGAPNIPTLMEQGIKLTIADWYGFVVPSKVPHEIVTLLNKEMNALLKEADVQDFLATKAGMQVSTCSPEECRNVLDKAYEQWGKTVSEANIKAE